MKFNLTVLLAILSFVTLHAQVAELYKSSLTTPWTKDVTPENAWQQYPRPQLEREEWMNLNGLWDYAIVPGNALTPASYNGKILVPFPVESFLSGVQKKVNPDQKLWYHTSFSIPENWSKQEIILHIGACDWESEIFVNGQPAGKHRGGYDHIDINITTLLKKGLNELTISVSDPTDSGWQALGKQVLNPGGIFYTPVTGIWQTVWLEPINPTHIQSVKYYTDISKNEVTIHTEIGQLTPNTTLKASAFLGGEKIAEKTIKAGSDVVLAIPAAKYWTPDHPSLYDLTLELIEGNQTTDKVKSYFGMRKIAIGKWTDGFTRILLNNEFVFQNGPLDQGFWPDGIYTQPGEDALKYDLTMVKNMGFNMLRKHVKVEPDRFYYWCDKMGILVWQDMPNGDVKIDVNDPDINRTAESEKQYRQELKNIIDQHSNSPSIIMWVPFNEGWGQFKTSEISAWIKGYDSTRLVNNASGWADRGAGDVLDVHTYPAPVCPDAETSRAIVIGEFGGLGLRVEDHMWEKTNWGYQNFRNAGDLEDMYSSFYETIASDVSKKGLSAVVYTQLTDVETEANGLMTYDRKVNKIPTETAFLINTLQATPKPEIIPLSDMLRKGDLIYIKTINGGIIRFTTDGSDPDLISKVYSAPIVFSGNMVLKACVFLNGKQGRTAVRSFRLTDMTRPVYLFPYSPKYTAGGDFALCDGIVGTEMFNDGNWQGFQSTDLNVTLDLQKETDVHHISVRFIENQSSWIFLPQKVIFEASSDGINFRQVEQFTINTQASEKKNSISTFKSGAQIGKIRFVRVVAVNIGICPDWHTGKGGKAWIFADEIKLD